MKKYDSLAEFLRNECVVEPGSITTKFGLHQVYRSMAKHKLYNTQGFGQAMRHRRYDVFHCKIWPEQRADEEGFPMTVYVNLKLKNHKDSYADWLKAAKQAEKKPTHGKPVSTSD